MRIGRRGPGLKDKIKSQRQLKKILVALKARGQRIVFTNGCFDLLHYGHVQYLEKAKKTGDCLVVALNSDVSARRIKGRNRPIINQKDRMRVVAALASVDFVTLFNQDTPLKIIRELRPDILVKGADWHKSKIVGSEEIRAYGGKVYAIKLARGRSTTNLIRKIAQQL